MRLLKFGLLIYISIMLLACGVETGEDTTMADGEWSTAMHITDNVLNTSNPQIAVNKNGNAFAVWEQYGQDGYDNIWSSRYVPGDGWQTATLIETDSSSASYPQVTVDSNGNALAVWHQYDGAQTNIWSNRYTPSDGWQTATLIETDNSGSAFNPQVAFDNMGNALAVWHQNDGTRDNIWSNRYTPSDGWQTAALIETDDVGDAAFPQIAIDTSGNALVVWHQYDGAHYNIWSKHYLLGDGWQTAALVETDDSGDAAFPQIAVDSSGNAFAVWRKINDGSRRQNIWSNRYIIGDGWQTAVLIQTYDENNGFHPQITIDSNGNALTVWSQVDRTGAYPRWSIWSNHYVFGNGWQTAVLIETDDAGDAVFPQIASDSSGNALAVWQQHDGVQDKIWSNRYVAGRGWRTSELIETDVADDSQTPQIAIDKNGRAIAVWSQDFNIIENHFE